ncbi:MAG: class I SAM-dependent methyltransferase [Cenarchaeum sp. SB0677_bin_16]|nr:class I SAM-dependent methyltransferase [Cenarchaeum sp. SB0677_bin_16]
MSGGPARVAGFGGLAPGMLDRLGRAVILGSLRRLKKGCLRVRTPDGAAYRFGGVQPGPEATITVRHPRFFRQMLADGEVGAGEAYIRGEWSADSAMEAVRLGILNRRFLRPIVPLLWPAAAAAWVAHKFRSNTVSGSRRNIHDHYDLGNEFFSLFLDPSMTYSCAYFDEERLAADARVEMQALEQAQLAKYRLLATKAGLRPGSHVLEIGCGWGGFAEVAASEFGCRVTGVTISRKQAAYARERMARAGLADRVSIKVVDYRDITGEYDSVVSIEMLEAVGHRFLPTYFRKCDEVLAPGGRAVIQVITIPDNRYLRYRLRPDYIQRFIFPGAHLPSLGALTRALRPTALGMRDREDLAAHYALTLATWRRRLLEQRQSLFDLGFDESFLRRWEFYFAYCEAAFRTRYVADWQLVLERRGMT